MGDAVAPTKADGTKPELHTEDQRRKALFQCNVQDKDGKNKKNLIPLRFKPEVERMHAENRQRRRHGEPSLNADEMYNMLKEFETDMIARQDKNFTPPPEGKVHRERLEGNVVVCENVKAGGKTTRRGNAKRLGRSEVMSLMR